MTPIPVGPHILCPENAKKSQPSSCTSTFLWGALCAPSRTTTAPCSCARLIKAFASIARPRTLLTWAKARIFTRGSSIFFNSSSGRRPVSLSTYIYSRTAPVFFAARCQGTRFEWCSETGMRMRSPSFKWVSPYERATRFKLSDVFLV